MLTDVTQVIQAAQEVVNTATEAVAETRVTQTLLEDHIDYTDKAIANHNQDVLAHPSIRKQQEITEATISVPVCAFSQVAVPPYIVDSHKLVVYIDGVKCERGKVYEEIGLPGSTSTIIRFTTDISDEYEVSVSC